MPGAPREKPSVFFTLTKSHLDDIMKGSQPAGVDQIKEEVARLRSPEAIANGIAWVNDTTDTTLFGLVNVGQTRLEKFREIHKDDGTGTKTEGKKE